MAQRSEYHRAYYEANREKIIARTGENRKQHPEKGRQYTRDYRARQRELNPPTTEPTPRERFDALIMPVTESGCWIWMGPLSKKGYAVMKIHQKGIAMHRWSYEHFVKPIPEGLTIDHLCRVKCCVNAFHFEVVTAEENTKRWWKWYWENADRTRPTHCHKGHEYTPENIMKSGKYGQYRMCRTCRNAECLAYYYANRKG